MSWPKGVARGPLSLEVRQKISATRRERKLGGHNRTHGDSAGSRGSRRHAAEYNIWAGMCSRCHNSKNPAYDLYGGRGIIVCFRWWDYPNFLADMGRRPSAKHSIDRINNDGNYEPGNCRWATQKEQMNNRRGNRWITALGRTQTVTDWAAETGLDRATIRYRMAHGLTADQAVSIPRQRGYPGNSPLLHLAET